MSVLSENMRGSLRLWASGVSVVTTLTAGERAGMTVSAFNSLSLDPPLILICLLKGCTVGNMLENSGIFAVSILEASQSHLSDRFSGRVQLTEGEDRFDGVNITSAETGSPILTESIAWLDCRVHARYEGGTHWIVVGEVVAAGQNGTSPSPLVYYNRGYHALEGQKENP
jgi:flavin reductase (DIM6/NTAB) family NADH-FMN oxidoreductase RutF